MLGTDFTRRVVTRDFVFAAGTFATLVQREVCLLDYSLMVSSQLELLFLKERVISGRLVLNLERLSHAFLNFVAGSCFDSAGGVLICWFEDKHADGAFGVDKVFGFRILFD